MIQIFLKFKQKTLENHHSVDLEMRIKSFLQFHSLIITQNLFFFF